MSANTPVVAEMQIIPVAGYDSMEMTPNGAHAPYFTRDLVIIKDSSGHVNIGEIYGGGYIYECLTSCILLVMGQEVDKYRSTLGCIHGGDKQTADSDGEGIQTPSISKLKFVMKAEWAIGCTLLDPLGQHLGVPVYELLAEGKRRDQVEVPGYLSYVSDKNKTDLPYLDESQSRNPWFRARRQEMTSHEQIAEQACCPQNEYDYRNFKLKGNVLLGNYEVDTVRALEEQFPRDRINMDPSDAWNLEEVTRLRRGMGNTLSYIEDPYGPEAGFSSREIMAELRSATGLLIATNMIVTNWRQFYHAAALKTAGIILTDPHFWGPGGSLHMVVFLNGRGLTWNSHPNNHFDIVLTTFTYVVAAAPGSPMALDIHQIWQDGQSLSKDTPVIENGYLEVSDRPGFGVTLNMDQVMEANKLYNRVPSHDRDDVMAMQCLIPGRICDSKKPRLVR